MPKKVEMKLMAEAKKKGFGKERTGAYVYGTLRKLGWTPGHQPGSSYKNDEVDHSPLTVIHHR